VINGSLLETDNDVQFPWTSGTRCCCISNRRP